MDLHQQFAKLNHISEIDKCGPKDLEDLKALCKELTNTYYSLMDQYKKLYELHYFPEIKALKESQLNSPDNGSAF